MFFSGTMMQLTAVSELARTQPNIPVPQSSVTLLGRSAPAPGKLPTLWVQVSGKHCEVFWDAEEVRAP